MEQWSLIQNIPYAKVNCLKTMPFTAARTYVAHIWQYLPRDVWTVCCVFNLTFLTQCLPSHPKGQGLLNLNRVFTPMCLIRFQTQYQRKNLASKTQSTHCQRFSSVDMLSWIPLDIIILACKCVAVHFLTFFFNYCQVQLLQPQPGWVELDPHVLWEQFVDVITEVIEGTQTSQSTIYY